MLIRKVVLMIALGLTCGSAMAEWTELGASNDQFIFYANKSSIVRKGSIAKMWHIYDFKSPVSLRGKEDDLYLSLKGQNEYDCRERKTKMLAYSYHSKGMGSGDVISSNYSVKETFEVIAPDSVYEMLFDVACGKH